MILQPKYVNTVVEYSCWDSLINLSSNSNNFISEEAHKAFTFKCGRNMWIQSAGTLD